MLLARLKEAIATRKVPKLEKAIADCEAKGIDNKDVRKAKLLLNVEKVKSGKSHIKYNSYYL